MISRYITPACTLWRSNLKAKLIVVFGLLLISALALSFTRAFISAALAGGGCVRDGNPDETVTCANVDTQEDITTSGGSDSVSVDNSDIGTIDTGDGNDLIQTSGPATGTDFIYEDDPSGFSTIGGINAGEGNNTLHLQNSIIGNDDGGLGFDTLGEGITVGGGHNRIDIGHSLVDSIQGGDGNNTITITDGALVGITTLGNGDNQVSVSGGSLAYAVGSGNGNNAVVVDQDSGVFFVLTGDGNDTIDTNNFTYLLDVGNGDDSVTMGAEACNCETSASLLDGGDGYDVLTFKFKVGSQEQKDSFNALVDGDASSGTVYFGGHYYQWANFEELEFLLRVARASGHDDVEVNVLKDSRLNNLDLAAPIAIYCKAGQIEGWVIDPATGAGSQQFVAPISAFPASSSGVDGAINGDQATISYSGYSFSFPAALCPG